MILVLIMAPLAVISFTNQLKNTSRLMSQFFFDQDAPSSDSDDPQQPSQRIDGSELSSGPKSLHKNKYIHKMRDLGAEQRSSLGLDPSVKSIDKKQRNKVSAKQSRDRKKLYIQILQERQKALAKQLQNKKKELQETKGYLQRVVNQNKTVLQCVIQMSGFTASRHQMMKKIKSLLERASQGENTAEEINGIIDSLRSRIGATGRERINTINQYFRQIVNLSLPALHRYMMWSASEGRHLFSPSDLDEDEWFLQLRNTLNLSQEQKHQIQSKRQFLKQQKHLLQSLIHDLKDIKNQIEQKSIQLQDMIDGIRSILTPLQAAHFILFIEKNKYRKELNLCEATIDEEEPALRKVVKRDI